MLTVELGAEAERLLRELADRAGMTQSDLAREAIMNLLQDAEDLRVAEERLTNPGRIYSAEEAKRELGLSD